MNKVAVPFKVTSDLMTSQGADVTCDAIDAIDLNALTWPNIADDTENITIKDENGNDYVPETKGWDHFNSI